MEPSQTTNPSTQIDTSSFPVYICASALEAFSELDANPSPTVIAIEQNTHRIFQQLSNSYTTNKIANDIETDIMTILAHARSDDFVVFETETVVVLDGKKFKFEYEYIAIDFAEGARDHINARLRTWIAETKARLVSGKAERLRRTGNRQA